MEWRSGHDWLRFEDVWLSYPMAWKIVWSKWRVADEGNECGKLMSKCKRVLRALFFWSRNKVRELATQKTELEAEISRLQEVDCSEDGLPEDLERQLRFKVQLLNATLGRLMAYWKQRAKVRWMDEGDANTHFFHSIATARRKSNRIQGVLPALISPEQAAFVEGRSISSHCLISQEVMKKFQNSKGFMALKIDMEQAYDRMSWVTLEVVLSRMGFPELFTNWVLACVSNPRFSLLINGKQTSWIEAKCGFRQGCPLSPYLFIICSELLSLAFEQLGGLEGISLGVGAPPISHLLYADDIFIFSPGNVKKILQLVNGYCAWTGQKVNKEKSVILYSKMTPYWKKARLTRLAGFRRVEEMEYLG